MDSALPFELPPAGSKTDRARPSALTTVGATTLANAADLGQLERLLAALAAHSQGAGFEHAYVLRWDPRLSKLCGRSQAEQADATEDLAATFDRARMEKSRRRERTWKRTQFGVDEIGQPASTAWRGGAVVIGEDGGSHTPWCDAAAIGAVVLERDGHPFALLVGRWKDRHADGRRDTLETIRRIANAAIVSVDRAAAARRRTQQAAAIAELARATSSPGNLGEILQRVVALAAQGVGAQGGALWLRRGDREAHLEVTHGVVSERERFGRAFHSLATAVIETGRGRVIEDPNDEFLLSPEVASQLTGVAAEPLVAYERTLGALAVYARQRSEGDAPGHDEADRAFLQTAAHLAALAVEHANRFNDVAEAERRADELRSELARLDWLSSVGEKATKIAPEARQPIASIQSFAKKVKSSLSDDDPRHDYLEIILSEAERLDHSLRASFDQVPIKTPVLKVERINAIVHKVLQHEAEALVRRRVRLVKKLAPDLPALLLDPERMRHALDNMLKSALDSVSMGGRIRFETRRVRQYVVVELAHDGASGTGGALEKVFEPFESDPTVGGALALGAVERIVREHGGEIRVRAEGDWSTIVTFTLPIRENQDRRKVPSDRRQRSRDRRKRYPERDD